MAYDAKRWLKAGAEGWDFPELCRLVAKLRTNIVPVDGRHRSQLVQDWISTCATLFDVPLVEDFNREIRDKGNLTNGVGFISMAYTPENNHRSSASVDYIHPILRGQEKRPNLTILTNAWTTKLIIESQKVTGVSGLTKLDRQVQLTARKEVILCAGAIDTPRLLLLSGVGPRKQLEALGIPVVLDVAGVGENLQDHCETMYMWELKDAIPEDQISMGSEGTMVLRREPFNARDDDEDAMDCMFHMFTVPFDFYTKPMGYDTPQHAFCVIPNTPRPRSVGRLYLVSADPVVKPALDQRYFTDSEGYDRATNLWMLKQARRMAEAAPFKQYLKREIAPGPNIVTDDELCEYGRKVSNTVYHPCGTAKMGDPKHDKLAVVDPQLMIPGLASLRIADASVFPCITTVNPMITVLAVGERAAELIIENSHAALRSQL